MFAAVCPRRFLLSLSIFATLGVEATSFLKDPKESLRDNSGAVKRAADRALSFAQAGVGARIGEKVEGKKSVEPLVPLRIHSLRAPGRHHHHGEDVLRSALAWEHKHENDVKYKQTGHDVTKVRVNGPVCGQVATQIGAMGCSLVTYMTGSPDGCECKMMQSSCPGVPAGFDAVEPSASFTIGSENVILCMYWQYGNADVGKGRAADAAVAKKKSLKMAEQLVKDAWFWTKNMAVISSNWMWAVTPTPYPRTPPPGGCGGGEWIANPHNLLHLKYKGLDHGGHEDVPCPDGYNGKYSTDCWAGLRTTQCANQITLGMGYVTCCKATCPEYKKVVVPQTGSGTGWGYLYSLSATVDVPKMNHGQYLSMKCPKGWEGSLTYKCNEGTSGVDGNCGAIVPNWIHWHTYPGFMKDSPFTTPEPKTTVEPTTTTLPPPPPPSTSPEPPPPPTSPEPTTSTAPEPTTTTPWYENPMFTTTPAPAPTTPEPTTALWDNPMFTTTTTPEPASTTPLSENPMFTTTTTGEPASTTNMFDLLFTTTTAAGGAAGGATTAGATTAGATTAAATTAAATTAAATTAAGTTAAATTVAATTVAATTVAATTVAATTVAATTVAATTVAATTVAATTVAATTVAATTAAATTGAATTGGMTTTTMNMMMTTTTMNMMMFTTTTR